MEYKANGTVLPVRQVDVGEMYTAEGIKRDGLRVALTDVPTAKQQKALAGGRIEVTGDAGEALGTLDDYTEVLECTVVLARPDAAQAERDTLASQVMALAQVAATALDDTAALAVASVWPSWRAGVIYGAGEIVRYGDSLYRVEQLHTAQAHQVPGGAGMLAVYRPMQVAQDGEMLPWASGEAVEVGDRRAHEGVLYECYTPAGANVHSPDAAPSVWRVVDA